MAERKTEKQPESTEEEIVDTSKTTAMVIGEEDGEPIPEENEETAAVKVEVDSANEGQPKNEEVALKEAPATQEKPKVEEEPKAEEEPKTEKQRKSAKVDDLTKIEGIGPKAAEALIGKGIDSYAALSKASPDKIKGMLTETSARMAHLDPSSWPKQAKMAADEKWDELKEWQDNVKGGVEK